MRCPIAIVLIAAATLAPSAHAETVASVASPDRSLKVELDLNGEDADSKGAARFRFVRETREVTRDDALKLCLAGGGVAVRLVPLEG